MSNFKFASHLFLGLNELNFFQRSLGEKGYRRLIQQAMKTPGVVKNDRLDPSFTSLKAQVGTSPDKITIQAGLAIDENGDVIEFETTQTDIIDTPTDSTVRYLKISYAQSVREIGTVSVAADGQMTGSGTEFLSRLRGMPNFPAKIYFPDSTSNTQEYEVLNVTDDLNAELNVATGVLSPESNLEYVVVGTFTPGIVPTTGEKYPFQDDSYSLVLETTDTITDGTQFLLASVVSDGITTTVVDLRTNDIFSLDHDLSDLQTTNPLITVMKAYYEATRGDGAESFVEVEWGFFASAANWSFTDPLLTIAVGSGGTTTATDDFVDGEFDGWYVYYESTGTKIKIVKSVRTEPSPGTYNIELRLANKASYPASSSESIVIVPPGQLIEIRAQQPNGTDATDISINSTFPIDQGKGVIKLPAEQISHLSYRYTSLTQQTPFTALQSSSYTNENGGSTAFNGTDITTLLLADSRATWGDEWTEVTGLDVDLLNGNTASGVASMRYKIKGKTVTGTLYGQVSDTDLTPATDLFWVDPSAYFTVKSLSGFFTAQAAAGWIAEGSGPERQAAIVWMFSNAIAFYRYDAQNYDNGSGNGVTFTANFTFEIQ